MPPGHGGGVNVRPKRQPTYAAPYHLAQRWFLSDTYLPYALGGGYVLGMDLAVYIARNRELLSLYNSEVWHAAL